MIGRAAICQQPPWESQLGGVGHLGGRGGRGEPLDGLADEIPQLTAVDPAAAGHLRRERRAPMDNGASARGGLQRHHRPVVPQRKSRLEHVGETSAGFALDHTLAAPMSPRGEEAHRAEPLRRGLTRLEDLERADR